MFSAELLAIGSKYGLRKGGKYLVGPCPRCGGSERSDKFTLRADGSFKCYACDFNGDRIQWLREMEGLSCKQAHERLGGRCSKPQCPSYGRCWEGQAGTRPHHRPKRQVLPKNQRRLEVPVHAGAAPEPTWAAVAEAMVAKAEVQLQAQEDQLTWLAARGIDRETVREYRLGWIAHDHRYLRQNFGLEPDANRPLIWVPSGLLIPILDSTGAIHRIRIRRTKAGRARFLPDRKYHWLQGSGTNPMILHPKLTMRGAVIVEAELDALAVAAAHPEVLVIALGTVAAGVDPETDALLRACPAILVALDADPGEGAAGPAAVGKWRQRYRQARFWPPPEGKDAGEYAMAGGRVHDWIEAGLPPDPLISALQHRVLDLCICPEKPSPGEEGEEELQEADDLAAFVEGLRQHEGCVYYSPEGDVVLRFRADNEVEGFEQRGALRQILYAGGLVSGFLETLPRGRMFSADEIDQLWRSDNGCAIFGAVGGAS